MLLALRTLLTGPHAQLLAPHPALGSTPCRWPAQLHTFLLTLHPAVGPKPPCSPHNLLLASNPVVGPCRCAVPNACTCARHGDACCQQQGGQRRAQPQPSLRVRAPAAPAPAPAAAAAAAAAALGGHAGSRQRGADRPGVATARARRRCAEQLWPGGCAGAPQRHGQAAPETPVRPGYPSAWPRLLPPGAFSGVAL